MWQVLILGAQKMNFLLTLSPLFLCLLSNAGRFLYKGEKMTQGVPYPLLCLSCQENLRGDFRLTRPWITGSFLVTMAKGGIGHPQQIS